MPILEHPIQGYLEDQDLAIAEEINFLTGFRNWWWLGQVVAG